MTFRQTLLALSLGLTTATCAPSPKHVSCSDDAFCKGVDPNYTYCSQRRCVECLGNAGCGVDNMCVDGMCQRKCSDGRDCRAGESCAGGKCKLD